MQIELTDETFELLKKSQAIYNDIANCYNDQMNFNDTINMLCRKHVSDYAKKIDDSANELEKYNDKIMLSCPDEALNRIQEDFIGSKNVEIHKNILSQLKYIFIEDKISFVQINEIIIQYVIADAMKFSFEMRHDGLFFKWLNNLEKNPYSNNYEFIIIAKDEQLNNNLITEIRNIAEKYYPTINYLIKDKSK